MMSTTRRGVVTRAMLAVCAGGGIGLTAAAAIGQPAPSDTDDGCHYCAFIGWILVCDDESCGDGDSCTGQVCPGEREVRACCNACPDDDWLETCDDDNPASN